MSRFASRISGHALNQLITLSIHERNSDFYKNLDQLEGTMYFH